jgi:DNA-binding SARP family transcriptional activator
VLKRGRPVPIRSGGKTEALLLSLSVCNGYRSSRDALLETLWPNSTESLCRQCLNTLICSLHRLLGDAIGGAAPVLNANGYYRLNVEAGVAVDVSCFDSLAADGERHARSGNRIAAVSTYGQALRIYRGDLCGSSDSRAVLERERLRTLHLTLLGYLADYHYSQGDYGACLKATADLLVADPCREDGHRLAMRCYVRRGERSQALRQYKLCEAIMRAEFDSEPEPATTALFHQVRLDPGSI